MLDIHSHILPALDDGVKTLSEAVETLRGLATLGFTDVVATPHFYPGRYTPPAEAVRVAFVAVEQALRGAEIPIRMIQGRECFLDSELLTTPDRTTFPFEWRGKRYQLIELPQITLPSALSSYAETLRAEGITPVLAHAERYNAIIRNPSTIFDYRKMGFRIQVDLASFSEQAHPKIRSAALRLLEERNIHVVASDIHHLDQLDSIGKGLERVQREIGATEAKRLCDLT